MRKRWPWVKALVLTLVLVVCLTLFMAPEALAKPPVPTVPGEWIDEAGAYCEVNYYEFPDPVSLTLPDGTVITSKYFGYAIYRNLEQSQNNKNKLIVVVLGYEIWAEGYWIIIDTFGPWDYPFSS